MSANSRRSLMRAADRAYYGVYTPANPIQLDSLRNRVHGAATCSSSLGKDDLILYESGLGKRKANAIEFAHYLEGLAKEMQPVLETLVRATGAEDEPAPRAWQFELEMQKHARSLREARSHSDLSFAHIAASQQCARAVNYYRKYRKQAEDLLRVTPQPEPAQRTTNPPTSAAPSVGHHTSHIAQERPPSPSIQASALSLPLLGQPAEEEEVGHGLPAHIPPQKDAEGLSEDGSGGSDSILGIATEQSRSSQHSPQSGKASEATRQELRVLTAPPEATLVRKEMHCDEHTVDARKYGNRSSMSRLQTWTGLLRVDQASRGNQETQLPSAARSGLSGYRDSPPHLAHLPNSVVLSPSMATAASAAGQIEAAPSKARLCPVPPVNVNGLAIKECDISAREGSRARRAPWSNTLRAIRSRRQHLSSCGPAPALGLTIPTRESSRVTVVLVAKAERLLKTRTEELLEGARFQWRCPPSSDSAPELELVAVAQEAAVSSAKVGGPSESAGRESLRAGDEFTKSNCTPLTAPSQLHGLSPRASAPALGLVEVTPGRCREIAILSLEMRGTHAGSPDGVLSEDSVALAIFRRPGTAQDIDSAKEDIFREARKLERVFEH
ncbi:hypothetical protein EV714DRAFT_269575 [Schizophyllum commune]